MGHGLRKRRRRYPIVIYVRHLTIDERRALEQEERRLWRAREESIAPDVVSTQEKRVRIALRSDEGWTAARIARDLGMSERTVRTWIARINETVPGALRGVDDLEDRRRSGHPTVYDAAHIADIVRALLAIPAGGIPSIDPPTPAPSPPRRQKAAAARLPCPVNAGHSVAYAQ